MIGVGGLRLGRELCGVAVCACETNPGMRIRATNGASIWSAVWMQCSVQAVCMGIGVTMGAYERRNELFTQKLRR